MGHPVDPRVTKDQLNKLYGKISRQDDKNHANDKIVQSGKDAARAGVIYTLKKGAGEVGGFLGGALITIGSWFVSDTAAEQILKETKTAINDKLNQMGEE